MVKIEDVFIGDVFLVVVGKGLVVISCFICVWDVLWSFVESWCK